MKKIIICTNFRANPGQPSCAARGSRELARCLEIAIAESKLDIKVEHSDCLGYCNVGPNLKMVPEGPFLHGLKKQDIPAILVELERFCAN